MVVCIDPSTRNELAQIWVVDEKATGLTRYKEPEDWVDFFGLTVLKTAPPFTHVATLTCDASTSTMDDITVGGGGVAGGGGGGGVSEVVKGQRSGGFQWVGWNLSQKVAESVSDLRGSWISGLINQTNLALW